MRFFFKLIFLMLFGLPLALATAVFLAVDTQPAVNRAAEVTPSSIERAKRILDRNDPRKLKPGARRSISVNAGDLDLAANYLAHRYGGGSARLGLENRRGIIGVSVRVPRLPVNLYLNVDATVVEQAPIPRLEALRIGSLTIPTWFARWLIAKGSSLVRVQRELINVYKTIEHVSITEHGVTLAYEWQEGALNSLRSAVLPAKDRQRIAIYRELLVSVAQRNNSKAQRNNSKNVSLVDFLVPLFQLTRERTPHSDGIGENRAAILVLAVYINGKGFEEILPEMKSRQRLVQHHVQLSQRDDLAKHFVVSAALAASAGSPLADAVGLYKEMSDSRGGSGFSFNDIAADRAGVRFGETAVNRDTAGKLQTKVSAGIDESDIMPLAIDLPEFLAEAEFKRRFGGVGGVEYKKLMAEIERRVAALSLYR